MPEHKNTRQWTLIDDILENYCCYDAKEFNNDVYGKKKLSKCVLYFLQKIAT